MVRGKTWKLSQLWSAELERVMNSSAKLLMPLQGRTGNLVLERAWGFNSPTRRMNTKRQRNEYFRKYREKTRALIRKYKLAKGCQKCGYRKNSSALGFHHKNKNKEYQIGRALGCRSFKSVLKEIRKCKVLCANCHAEKHYPENKRVISPEGERSSYKREVAGSSPASPIWHWNLQDWPEPKNCQKRFRSALAWHMVWS